MMTEQNKDLDLKELAQLIYSVINRRIKLIGFLFVITLSVGAYNYFISTEAKSSYYLVKCNTHFYKQNEIIKDLKTIGLELSYNLSNYIENKNHKSLSSLLKLEPNSINNVEKIKIIEIDKESNCFRLYFYFKGDDSTKLLANAIIEKLNNQDYFKKNQVNFDDYYANYLNDLNREFQKLDSLNIYDSINNIKKLKASSIYQYKLNIIKEINKIENQSKINEPFYLINGENNIIMKTNQFMDFLKYVFYFLFLSFTIILVIETIQFLKKKNNT